MRKWKKVASWLRPVESPGEREGVVALFPTMTFCIEARHGVGGAGKVASQCPQREHSGHFRL